MSPVCQFGQRGQEWFGGCRTQKLFQICTLVLRWLLRQHDRTIYPGKLRASPAERRSNFARLIGHAIGLIFHIAPMRVKPLDRPVFDFNDSSPRWSDHDNVDFIGLELMIHGERQVRQHHPLFVTRFGLQPALQMLAGLQLTLIRCRSTGEESYSHLLPPKPAKTPPSVASKASEMCVRKLRSSMTCVYSAASMLSRSA